MKRTTATLVLALAALGVESSWTSSARGDEPADLVAPAEQPAEPAAPDGAPQPREGRKPGRGRRAITPEMMEQMRAARGLIGTTSPTTEPTTATTSPSTSPTTSTAPTTGSTTTTTTTSPSLVAPTPPFPKDYDVLLKRSMFARGAPKPEKNAAAPQGPEANFGLRGVGVQDGQFIALIEDNSSKSTKSMKQGEPLATGKIKSIDIDSIVYEGTGGKTQKVTIGQNLLGAPLPPPPAPQPKPPEQPQGAQPGQPGQPGQPPQPGQPGGPQPGRRGR